MHLPINKEFQLDFCLNSYKKLEDIIDKEFVKIWEYKQFEYKGKILHIRKSTSP